METVRRCDHDDCPGNCLYQPLSRRREEFWMLRWAHLPTDELGTDPVAWLDGLYED